MGDTLWLWVELPDEEATGNCYLECVVIKRVIPIGAADEQEAWLTVHTDDKVPKGHIADSPEWPSQKHGERREQLDRDLEQIRNDP